NGIAISRALRQRAAVPFRLLLRQPQFLGGEGMHERAVGGEAAVAVGASAGDARLRSDQFGEWAGDEIGGPARQHYAVARGAMLLDPAAQLAPEQRLDLATNESARQLLHSRGAQTGEIRLVLLPDVTAITGGLGDCEAHGTRERGRPQLAAQCEKADEADLAAPRDQRSIDVDEDQWHYSTPAGLVRLKGRASARNSRITGKALSRHTSTEE